MDAPVTFRLSELATAKPQEKMGGASVKTLVEQTSLSDEALLHQVSQGNGETLDILFRRYSQLVRGIAFKILRNACEADDVLQEVFLSIHRKSELFDSSKNSARSWIVQVTYHRAIDSLRYLQSRHFYTRVDLEDAEPELGDDRYKKAIEAVDQGGIRKLFESLSQNQRHTMQLFFFEGLTFEEIACRLGQTRGNVKNHYFRGLDKLRKQLLHRNSAPDSGV